MWFRFISLLLASALMCGCATKLPISTGSSYIEIRSIPPYPFNSQIQQSWYFDRDRILALSISSEGVANLSAYDGTGWQVVVEWNLDDYFRSSMSNDGTTLIYAIKTRGAYLVYQYVLGSDKSKLIYSSHKPILSINLGNSGTVIVMESGEIFCVVAGNSKQILSRKGVASPIIAQSAIYIAVANNDISTNVSRLTLLTNDGKTLAEMSLDYQVEQLVCSQDGSVLFISPKHTTGSGAITSIYEVNALSQGDRQLELLCTLPAGRGMKSSPDASVLVIKENDRAVVRRRSQDTWLPVDGIEYDWSIFANHSTLSNNAIYLSSAASGILLTFTLDE